MTSPIRAEIDAAVAAKSKADATKDYPTYSETDGEKGTAGCIAPENATKRDLLIHAGLDPDLWQISGKVNTRTWGANAGGTRRPARSPWSP